MKKRLSFVLLSLLSSLVMSGCNNINISGLSGLTSGSSESTTSEIGSSSSSQTSASSSASATSSESSASSSESSSSSSTSIMVMYTIAFEENGGSAVADITQSDGTALAAPSAPTKTGYSFVGWYSDVGLTTAFTFGLMPSENITLYAEWQINQYTISFDTNGGTTVAPIIADYNSPVSAPFSPYKTGYSFNGWFSDASLINPYMFTTMPLDGTTVYAKWDLNEVTVTFVTNGGSDVPSITQNAWTVVNGPEAPTKTGYTFVGWFIDMDLTMPAAFPTTVTDPFSVYAKWAINQYTITFAVDGGSSVAPITQDYDTVVMAPADPTKLGFVFSGWFSDHELATLYTFSTMPAESITIYARWEVDPLYGTISIADFKATTDGLYHEVAGVVLFAPGPDMGIIVITDDTGILVVESNGLTQHGDFIKVGGTLQLLGDYLMMSDLNLDSTLLMILAHDRPIPIDPTPMTAGIFNALDPNQSSTWINYLEISGTLTANAMSRSMSLVDGTDILPLLVMDMDTYNLFMEYEGFKIRVRGISLPNMDAEPFLMFVFTGEPTDIQLDYTDAELVAHFGQMLIDYISSGNYFPGQYSDLPDTHPVAPIMITYETFGTNAGLLDLVSGQISPEIETALVIDVRATIVLREISLTVEIPLHVAPLNLTNITDFLLLPDFVEGGEMNFNYLKGTVIHLQLENNMLMIADETGVIYVNTSDTSIQVGDEIIAYGLKMSANGMTFIAGYRAETVLAILSSGNPLPLARTHISLADFLALDVNAPANALVYFSMTGVLSVADAVHFVFMLSDGTSTIPVLASDATDYAFLLDWVGVQVSISGLSAKTPEPSTMLLVFINFPGDIVLASA